ncbi:MAG: DUF885 domain-containing protein [Planctomycetes bacterium]|nr:DUF885 domain-containing protein [Planctomycetota bacterium]
MSILRSRKVFVLAAIACWLLPQYGFAESIDEQFTALIDEIWEFDVLEDPLLATSTGDHRYNDRLPTVSLADSARRNEARRNFLTQVKALDRQQLSSEARINYDILLRKLRDDLAEFDFQRHLIPISQRSGFHVDFPELPKDVPLKTIADYENYAARLRAFGAYADGHIELMRAGIAAGQTLPVVVLDGWEKAIDAQIVERPTQSLLYAPGKKFPATVKAEEHERLQTEISEAIATSVVPAYRRFRKFMAKEYVPGARGSLGASALPRGRDFYRHRVRRFTTLDVTPEEIHQLGLAEVQRIRGEMDEIIRRVEFEGDFSAFTKFLREDPQFYAETEEELLQTVAYTLKKMDGKLPTLFGKLPRMPYGLRRVPEYIAPQTTAAYYQRPSGDGTRAGFYYMNTYNLKNRPLFTVAALSLHEAVPGHHLQLALQQEIESLPNFRRFSGFTAFVEGWALYAERLGLEVGFYEDPYSDFGRLTMEIWRACRLVVDTGIHYFGWTREQAIAYMTDNSALSEHNIRSEVDRYISWPGQALAYKMGELKIRELRKMAEERLGERFDIRDFHDMILGSGAVPLDVLEVNTRVWLDGQ